MVKAILLVCTRNRRSEFEKQTKGNSQKVMFIEQDRQIINTGWFWKLFSSYRTYFAWNDKGSKK